MKSIMLADESFVYVDDEDFEYLRKFDWRRIGHGYAVRVINSLQNKQMAMHTEVAARMGLKGLIDHKDRDKRNNTRTNLREATYSQNGFNRKLSSNNTSGYRGVIYRKDRKKWYAEITVEGHTFNLGLYKTKEEAAEAYKKAAHRYFGEFAEGIQ